LSTFDKLFSASQKSKTAAKLFALKKIKKPNIYPFKNPYGRYSK